MTTKTFVLGKDYKAGNDYKENHFMTQAVVITDVWPLKDQIGCTLCLVGPYYLAESWPEISEFLLNNRATMGICVMNKEWDYD